MLYNIGDRVLIVNYRTGNMNSYGYMDKYLNTIMTITNITTNAEYKMLEDQDDEYAPNGKGWYWKDIDIKCKVIDDNRLERV